MYQPKYHQLAFENFHLPFGGKLDSENRWVKLADMIPWHVAEKMYVRNFPSKRGAPALTVRMALGSLIIKEKLGLSESCPAKSRLKPVCISVAQKPLWISEALI